MLFTRRFTFRVLLTLSLAFSAFSLTACSTDTNETTTAPPENSTASSSVISIDTPYVRAMPPGQPNSAMFVTLQNGSDKAVRLMSASSPVAEVVELHAHQHKDGMMQMYQVEHIEIPAHGSTELKPGGLHIMLLGLKQNLNAGDEIQVSLNFDDSNSINLSVPVKHIQPKM